MKLINWKEFNTVMVVINSDVGVWEMEMEMKMCFLNNLIFF